MVAIQEHKGICESAGVILENKNKKGEFLAVYRKIKPEGWGLPSCHTIVERTGVREKETPSEVVRRMMLEETGIRLVNIYHLADRMVAFDHPCRYGYRHHFCAVFGVKSYEGEPRVCRPEKHDRVEFVSAGQLAEFEKSDKTDPAWYKFLLKDEEIREVIWTGKVGPK